MKTRTKVLLKAAELIDERRWGDYFWTAISYTKPDLKFFEATYLWAIQYTPERMYRHKVEDRVMLLCLLAAVSETEA